MIQKGFGFFKDTTIKKKSSKIKIPKNPCEQCGLYKNCQSPKMEFSGEGKKEILIIGEAPGKQEDLEDSQFSKKGSSGKLLRSSLSDLDIDLDIDCWKTNSLSCRPSKNRAPKDKEIKLCRPRVWSVIEKLKPKKIILLGQIAVKSFLDHRMGSIGPMQKWVGWCIPDQEVKAWVFPIFHPSYLNRQSNNVVLWNTFYDHLEQAIDHSKDFPWFDEKRIQVITDVDKVNIALQNILDTKPTYLFFDYETTGLKPYAPGHKIYSISIATDPNGAISFPYFHNNRDFLVSIYKILSHPRIKKVAQNIKFEDTWTRVKGIRSNGKEGYLVKPWYQCTMNMTHTIDNRRQITSMDFQAYVRYGMIYGQGIKKYLKGVKEKNANSLNKIEEAPIYDLLYYGGLDSYFGFNLFIDQLLELPNDDPGYQLLHEGVLALSDVEANGIHTDSVYLEKQSKKLSRQIKIIKTKIDESKEMRLWNKETNNKSFNPNSPLHLKKLLFEFLDHKSEKRTKHDNPSLDKEVLASINIEFTRDILELRKLSKLKSTYIDGFIRESVDNIMRPFNNLHLIATYRSSNDSPNFQNNPKRDKKALRIVRKAIIPRPEHMLGGVDYSGIEVRMAACNTHDPILIEDVTNPEADMHRDQAIRLFIFDKEEWEELLSKETAKDLRYLAKNLCVFPWFYGDWYEPTAKNIWKIVNDYQLKDGTSLKKHLLNKGIKTYNNFESHIKKEEKRFWNKFSTYAEWKERTVEAYEEKGYVELLTGFKCGGILKKNELLNYPNQGPAFHCLLWSLIQTNKIFKKEKLDTKIIGQIHDEMVLDINPSELDYIKPIIRKIMCKDIKEHWPWIIVPLDIDMEISKIDGNWANMKETKI